MTNYNLTFTSFPTKLWWYDHTLENNWHDFGTVGATSLPFGASLVLEGFKYNKETNSYSVSIEAPGYKKNEISVEVPEEGLVVVTAKNEKKGIYTRSFSLYDVDLNSSTTSAVLEDGILTVTVKAPPVKQPVKIEVR